MLSPQCPWASGSGDHDVSLPYDTQVITDVQDYRFNPSVTEETDDSLPNESPSADHSRDRRIIQEWIRYSDDAVSSGTGTVRRSLARQRIDILVRGNFRNRTPQRMPNRHLHNDTSYLWTRICYVHPFQ
ncbi:hypothetical protein NOGI109294_18315 [Nocardiopsis gilva]